MPSPSFTHMRDQLTDNIQLMIGSSSDRIMLRQNIPTLSTAPSPPSSDHSVLNYVNPFIGTTNYSACHPGAVLPNGMMSVVPFNVMGSELNHYDKDERWWSAPYDNTNKYFTGFAHVTLSGVGCPEMGTLLTMPTTGPLDVDYHHYGTEYADEQASPGYYAVRLKKYGVRCEVSSTLRCSAERYTFPKGEGHILLNLGAGLTNEVGGMVHRVSETEIEGYRLLGNFCYQPQAVFPIYFVMRVNKRPVSSGYWKKQPPMSGPEKDWDADNGNYKLYTAYGKELAGDDVGYYFSYHCEEDEQIEVQMGVSFVSIDNARENLNAEQPLFVFDDVHQKARDQWDATLSRVTVEGGTEAQRRMFYTALYHTQIHPNIIQDINGQYPKMESLDVGTTSGNRYTVFSLWDTYRNVHPLNTLLYPDKQLDMVRSMIAMYREWGWMPRWELYGRETWTMEGDPAIPVIADTWLKGLRDFDIATAYEAFCRSATLPSKDNKMRPDIDTYLEKGHVPIGEYAADMSGDNSVSHALEYYIADAALANLAEALGKTADSKRFRQQSLGYRHYYSKESGTLRPILQDNTFLTPFNPNDGANFSTGEAFTDWTNPRTGVKMIKVQHPEFETYLGAGSQHAALFTCADCHMAKQTAEDGTVTHSHYLASPLENEELVSTTCALCHNGTVQPELSVLVPAIQAQTEERTNTIGNQLADLTDQLAIAVESGKYTDGQLAEIRSLARDAQFYWDFVFVENSEGAHNSALTKDCLDKAEALCTQAFVALVTLINT